MSSTVCKWFPLTKPWDIFGSSIAIFDYQSAILSTPSPFGELPSRMRCRPTKSAMFSLCFKCIPRKRGKKNTQEDHNFHPIPIIPIPIPHHTLPSLRLVVPALPCDVHSCRHHHRETWPCPLHGLDGFWMFLLWPPLPPFKTPMRS